MKPAHPWTALYLLLTLAACRYSWQLAPEQHEADAWNIAQAVAMLSVLGLLALVYRRSGWVLAALALPAVWQSLTVACSAAYIVRPWPVLPGQEQCDAALDAPLSVIGVWLAVLLIAGLSGAHRDARAG